MPFEARISELSDKLASCKDESEALKLTQELQAALHERIEQLRTQTSGMALLPPRQDSDEK
jgi:predicted  nucleic acid-binding Zn-ribbon protein